MHFLVIFYLKFEIFIFFSKASEEYKSANSELTEKLSKKVSICSIILKLTET